jgi:GMP synthase-like glutamine amidotransferase
MRILVLENDPVVPVGRFADLAIESGHELSFTRLHIGESMPAFGRFDAVVVLGGGMGAYEVDRYPYLSAEKEFLAEAVGRGVPVLGLCLGSQLLADALGGRAYLAPKPEVGLSLLTTCTEDDPIGDALGSGLLVVFHRDTFDVPPGAVVLASGGGFIHGFRCGSAVAIQPHPEVTQETLEAWIDMPGSRDILEGAGVVGSELKQQARDAAEDVTTAADSVLRAWLAEAQLLVGSS